MRQLTAKLNKEPLSLLSQELQNLNANQVTYAYLTHDYWLQTSWEWKKHSERRKHCTLAVVRPSQKFSPRRRPLHGGVGRPKFNQLEMSLPSPTDPVWWKSMHAISSYRDNRPTYKQRPPARLLVANTQTGPITIHCAAKLSAQCKKLHFLTQVMYIFAMFHKKSSVNKW